MSASGYRGAMTDSNGRGSLYVYGCQEPLPSEILEATGLVPIEAARESAGHTCSPDSCDCLPQALETP
jgi:hypothetical protein